VFAQAEHGELTYKEAQKRYGIQGRSTVLTWLRKHRHLDWYNLSSSDLMSTEMLQHMLKSLLAERQIKLRRDVLLFNLLRQARLLVPTKRSYHQTTHSHHRFYKHPNLLEFSNGCLRVY
jgi:hypothetical protein